MGPLAIISLISTASDVISGISKLVSDNSAGGDNGGGSIFSNLVNGSSNSQASANSRSSLEVTPQGAIPELVAQGSAILAGSAQEGISTQTLEDLNNILAGNGKPTDVNALSGDDEATDISELGTEGDTKKINILGITKLDDPFGIKAAQANGAQIAAPLVVPADSTAVLPIITTIDVNTPVSAGGISANGNEGALGNGVIKQSTNTGLPVQVTANGKEGGDKQNNNDLFELTSADSNSAKQIQNGNASNVVGDKANSASTAQANNLAENIQRRNDNLLHHNPNLAGMVASNLEGKTIGEAVRAVRGKDEVNETLSTIDTYKVVSVSKKDNVIDLRLEPAQLGKVQIKLDFSDGKTNIMVIADRQDTLNLLQRDTRALEKILTDNGMNVDSSSLSFDLRGQQQQQQNPDNSNFFTGRPLSFLVEEQINNLTASNDIGLSGYDNYGEFSNNGMLNIMV
jgi:flagellar hook-length control protein FliK